MRDTNEIGGVGPSQVTTNPPPENDVLLYKPEIGWTIGYVVGDQFNTGGYWHSIHDRTYWLPLPNAPTAG